VCVLLYSTVTSQSLSQGICLFDGEQEINQEQLLLGNQEYISLLYARLMLPHLHVVATQQLAHKAADYYSLSLCLFSPVLPLPFGGPRGHLDRLVGL